MARATTQQPIQRSALPPRRAVSIIPSDRSGGGAAGEPDKDGRLSEIPYRADMYRYAVASGSPAANSRVEPVDAWQVEQADHRLAGNRIGDGDAPQRHAAQES